ncbi:hypothetical protein [Cellulophaga sp. Z1A5H]|uniref:hypothetical protein n=1 Tax=Cellulophaga sp. Z1A5H TaxID=2687291 RepID=UPI0013FD3E0E|nr:hypothetical protein [Cellulophaga sp. Z1A5H]
MKSVELGNIKLVVDSIETRKFYETQNGFVCNCPDCLDYVSKISNVQLELNGIDKEFGIDLYKAVGQGMDELMPHDYDGYHLYVVPYYVIGKLFVNGKELEKESSGSIWSNTRRVEKRLTKNLSLIITTTEDITIVAARNILTIWLEYKTGLRTK